MGSDILCDSRQPVRLALRITHRKTTVIDPSHRTVGTNNSIEFLQWFRFQFLEECQKTVAILAVDRLRQPFALSIERRRTAAPHFFKGGADIEGLFCTEVEHPKDL